MSGIGSGGFGFAIDLGTLLMVVGIVAAIVAVGFLVVFKK